MHLFNVLKVVFLMSLLGCATQVLADDDMNTTSSIMPKSQNSPIVARSPQDDASLTSTMQKLIGKSNILSPLDIAVSTKNGVVSLAGEVDSATHVDLLIELAESIVGVSDVDVSRLTVKDSQSPVADSVTTAKIKGLFIREKLFGEKDIAAINTSVETKDGVVYLSGVVDNKKQIENAIKVIKENIPEVKKVVYSVHKKRQNHHRVNSRNK